MVPRRVEPLPVRTAFGFAAKGLARSDRAGFRRADGLFARTGGEREYPRPDTPSVRPWRRPAARTRIEATCSGTVPSGWKNTPAGKGSPKNGRPHGPRRPSNFQPIRTESATGKPFRKSPAGSISSSKTRAFRNSRVRAGRRKPVSKATKTNPRTPPSNDSAPGPIFARRFAKKSIENAAWMFNPYFEA